MPKVEYSKAKGLVQSTGSGFVMATETLTGAAALVADPGVAVTLCNSTAKTIVLADGTSVGQLKWFIAIHADDNTVDPTTTAGAWDRFVLAEVGDSACLMWTVPGWVLLARGSGATNAADAFDGPLVA
jgi:hypothetical protein